MTRSFSRSGWSSVTNPVILSSGRLAPVTSSPCIKRHGACARGIVLMMILFAMTGRYSCVRQPVAQSSISAADPASCAAIPRRNTKSRADYCGWTKPRIERGAFSAGGWGGGGGGREGRVQKVKGIYVFLRLHPSFLPSDPPLNRRRSALTADAYEADVKTFVKYEGIRVAEDRFLGTLEDEEADGARGAPHC